MNISSEAKWRVGTLRPKVSSKASDSVLWGWKYETLMQPSGNMNHMERSSEAEWLVGVGALNDPAS